MNSTTTDTTQTFTVEHHGAVAVVVFDGFHHSNAMSQDRMRVLRGLLLTLEADASVDAIVLRGGEGQSFAVGGDFNEVSHFTGGDEVDDWIDAITDLYVTSLEVSKPTLAAVDGHAIGIGLQLALTCDFRIGSESVSLRMPEFQLGIACNFGGYMLERSVGRSVMQKMLMSCEPWSAEAALTDGLLHEVVPDRSLADVALAHAQRFATYNPAAFRNTKPYLNRDYVQGLRNVQQNAKISHRAGFASGLPQQRMRSIIGHD